MNDNYKKVSEFLKGRYSRIDELNNLIFYILIILLFLNILINNNIIRFIVILLIFIFFYRILSKKIYQRAKENTIYLNILKKLKNIFKKKNNDKNHIYKKCHHCKTILKFPIPYERGIKHSKCPNCHKRNTFLILRKEKVEIIRKGKTIRK